MRTAEDFVKEAEKSLGEEYMNICTPEQRLDSIIGYLSQGLAGAESQFRLLSRDLFYIIEDEDDRLEVKRRLERIIEIL